MTAIFDPSQETAYSLLLESIASHDVAMTVYDPNDCLVVCNEAYLKVYERSRDLIVPGARFEDIIREGARRGQYPAAQGNVEEWVEQRLIAHRNPTGQGIEQELDDGRWLLIVENRTPGGYTVGSRLDITARKHAELKQQQLARALRLLSECNATLVHSTDEATLLRDICRQIVHTGGYLLAWVGFSGEAPSKAITPVASFGIAGCALDAIGSSWDENEEIASYPSGLAVRTGRMHIERNFQAWATLHPYVQALVDQGCRAGAAFPLIVDQTVIGNLTLYSASTRAFEDDERQLLSELAANIAFGIKTLRNRAELDRYRQTLEQQVEERTSAIGKVAQNMRLFITQAPIAIAMFDHAMNYMEASGRWLDDYGLTGTDWRGQSHYAVHPDLPAEWRPVHQRALAGETVKDDESLWVHEDGTHQWLRWVVQPWTDENGRIGGIIISAEDITPRKLADDALHLAVADAERADNAKSRFLAAASHDLRQPLAALRIYTGSLKGYVSEAGTPLLANMTDCIDSLSELLGDLLDLSKLDAGVVVPQIRDFPLRDVLEPLMATHGPSAALKGLRIRNRPSAMVVRSDPVLLRRIIGNFLSNAVRYTARGGLLVACRSHGGRHWLEVRDTGIGFDPDKIPEIFEEFKQLDDGARTRGSGLGLAIVKRTADLLGLAIRVQTRPGHGSLFAIELPAGTPLPETPASPAPVPCYRPLRIALVEDNTAVRDALTLSLTHAGHRIFPAATGHELIAHMRGTTLDILVTDYRLPEGQTGFDVIEAVRASAPDLPAILLTGDTDPRLVRQMAEHGVTVLHKPLDLETLLAYLEDMTCQAAS